MSEFDYIPPTTDYRTGELLALRHGAESLTALVEQLPEDARVLDVGAGDSTFAPEAAVLGEHKGVQVTTVDIAGTKQSEDPRPNLTHITGDATRLTELVEPDSQDLVTSYFMLPHMSPTQRRKAIAEMYTVTKPGGTLSVGPSELCGLYVRQPGKLQKIQRQRPNKSMHL